jgi:hypothetical protein
MRLNIIQHRDIQHNDLNYNTFPDLLHVVILNVVLLSVVESRQALIINKLERLSAKGFFDNKPAICIKTKPENSN